MQKLLMDFCITCFLDPLLGSFLENQTCKLVCIRTHARKIKFLALLLLERFYCHPRSPVSRATVYRCASIPGIHDDLLQVLVTGNKVKEVGG